ncbi:hypothetical protein ACWF50_23325 [Brucella pseudogrignonensis]
MSDLKKPAASLKDKFDVARTVELRPAVSVAPASSHSPPTPTSPLTAYTPASKTRFVSLPFTFAFQQSDYKTASKLAARIGCSVDDMVLVISRRFDERTLDLTTTCFPPRNGPSKRVLLKISYATLTQIRQTKDPLNVRSDGYLLRAPVIAALDMVATLVLNELEQRYRA